jgi:RND family efflux transporter MFP subunit
MSLVLFVGCTKKQAETIAPPPPEVVVARPSYRDVTDFEDFTGRTEANFSVDIRSRVTGYLEKILFTDGADVQKGQELFQIDSRTYRAEVERAEAKQRQNEAHVERLGLDLRRARALLPSRAISREEVDKISGDQSEALASFRAAHAALELARLNLVFTRISAPVSGRISRRFLDEGNLVKADDTILTSIVALDPIDAYFDIDERTVLKLRRLIHEGKIQSARKTGAPVDLGLADEEGHSLKGVVDFADNRLDPGTGTLRIRVRIDNPNRLLSPGMFVRLRLPVGEARPSILVPEDALGSDQDRKFLYVVDADNKAVYRQVQIGQINRGLRVIKSGLKPGERVVVKGLQRVRRNEAVTPLEPEAPRHVADAGAARPAS